MRPTIQSFVIRAGRLSERQKRGLENGSSLFLLRTNDGILDSEKIFHRNAPLVLEIGFGMGKSLIEMAKSQPEKFFLGIEVHKPGIGALFADLLDHDLQNVRVYAEDAVLVLEKCIADESLDRVQIFFPDPWQKRRHHKRRLIQPAFVKLLVQKLKINGELHLATDWENYAEQMLEVLSAESSLKNESPSGFYLNQGLRPLTKFEARGIKLGHKVFDLVFKKAS